MNAVTALTIAGFREALRNRVTVVVGVFTAVLISLTVVVLNTTVFTLDRAVTDFGLGVMTLLLVGLTAFMSAGMLSREIERRTVFLVMSRPLSRTRFVIGRYFGVALTLSALFSAMALIYLGQLALFEVTIGPAIWAALLGIWFELLLLAALGFFLSSFAGQLTAAMSMLGLWLIGHWVSDLRALADRAKDSGVGVLARAVAAVVPNLERLDYRTEAAWGSSVETGELLAAVGMSLAWTVAFLVAATLTFERRDFK